MIGVMALRAGVWNSIARWYVKQPSGKFGSILSILELFDKKTLHSFLRLDQTWSKANMDTLKGQFLIAMPSMLDFNFSHTVTCMSEDTEDGSLGIVINRVIPSLTAGSIFRELNIEYTDVTAMIPLHIGGPVHENEIFILHGEPFSWEGCLMITPTLAMSNTMDLIEAIAKGEGPQTFLIALGCAGWGKGQLAAEILQNVWLTSPVDDKIIFESKIDERWHAAVRLLGIDPVLLSDTPGHA